MKSSFSRVLTSVFIVIFLASCTKSVVYLSQQEAPQLKGKSGVIVEKTDGETVRLKNVHLENQAIVGTAPKQGQVKLDFSSIKSVRIEKMNSSMAVIYGGASLVLALLTIGAATAPEPPPSECCPFIYAYDGEAFYLDAEPFGAALCEGQKRAEWTAMEHLKEIDGTYRVLVANELEETQYTDELRLLVADHPAGIRVVPDATGGLHTVSAPQNLLAARDSRGADIRDRLAGKGGLAWETDLERVDPEVPGSLREELTLEFAKPVVAKTAKLLVNASTSLWGAQMGKRFLRLHGDALQGWYDEVNRHGRAYFETMAWHLREEMYLMQIRVLTGSGWKTKGTIYGGGPFVSAEKAYAIDIADVPGDTLTIRLTPPANFWTIDSLAVDYSADLPLSVIEVEPNASPDPKSRDIAARLRMTDGSYLAMPEGSEPTDVVFGAPPVSPGTSRTIILKASGYYELHIETAGVRPRPDILKKFASEPGSMIRFAMEEYAEWKAEQDANQRAHKTGRN